MPEFKLPNVASHIQFLVTQLFVKLLWSDEIKVILGSTLFYPILATTALFLATKVSPVRVVNKCACYCNRKLKAIWMRVQVVLKKLQAQQTVLTIKRSHMLGSMKVLAVAAEILIF